MKRNGKIHSLERGVPGPTVSMLDAASVSRACSAWLAKRGIPSEGFRTAHLAEIAAATRRRLKSPISNLQSP